jgi:hypothetical protein
MRISQIDSVRVRVQLAMETHQLRSVGADRVLKCGSVCSSSEKGHGGHRQPKPNRINAP